MRPIRRFEPSHLDDVPSLFHALLLGILGLWLYYKFLAPVERLNFEETVVFGAIALPLIAMLRAALRAANLRRQGPERVFAVAHPEDIEMLHRKFRNHPEYEMELVGAVDEDTSDELGLRLSADLDEVEMLVAAGDIDHLMVRLDATYIPQGRIHELMRLCHREGVRFGFFPGVKTLLPPGIEVNHLEGVGFLSAHPPVLARSGMLIKRGIDIVLSSLLLIGFAPFFAAIALAIKLDSKGPVFFRQTRIGKDGVPFRLLKFRTMVENAEELEDELMAQSLDPDWLVVRDDPRITGFGRILRRTSLDEMPQLWNVLKGEMSVVGPRPLSERDDAKVEGWKRHRLDVVPGVTGYWQVLGRNNIPFEEMLEVDYCYVTSWSIWHDMKLLLKTFPVVLMRRGAN
jgi:exopolysaccharide biosynthesis polyprenyl glycosylphosphotransferase